jgi:hypothetical protein
MLSYIICHLVLSLDPFGTKEVLEWLLLLATETRQSADYRLYKSLTD